MCCVLAFLKETTAVSGGAGNINAPLSIVEAQRASLGKQDAATSFNKVTLTVMEQFILKRTPGETAHHLVLVT